MIKSIKNLTPRLAEIGKIKIGGKSIQKKKTTKGYDYQPPVRYDHIVVTKMTRDKNGNLEKDHEVMKQLGEKSRILPVKFLYDSIELIFPTSYALYYGAKCWCRGDGEIAERLSNDGGMEQIKCDPFKCKFIKDKKCKPNGRLSAELPYSKKVGGVYIYRTCAWNSVQNILGALKRFSALTGGKLANIPFLLEMIKIDTPKQKGVETMNLVYPDGENNLLKAALAETKRRETYKLDIKKYEKLAIESGVTDDHDDPGEIENEFYQEDKIITNETKALEIDADKFVVSKPVPAKKVKKVIAKDGENVGELL